MRVLVSFFSDQHFLPVHQGIKHLAPEKHIVLHLETPINLAKRFGAEASFQTVANAEDSIINALNEIFAAHQNDELHLNLSGGTDLMQLCGLHFARRTNLKAYRFEPNAVTRFDENGVAKSDLPSFFTIEEYIKLHGFRIIKNSEELATAQKLMGALSGYLTATHIQKLNSAADKEFLVRMPGRLEIQIDAPEGAERKVAIKTSGFQKLVSAESLVEIFMYQQLQPKYKGAIQLALRIVREGGSPRDIDLAFLKDGLLHIIVSRGNPNIRGGIFEQLFAIHQRFEGLTAKIHFLMKESSATNPNNLKRAKLFGIELVSIDQIGSL
ncbi:MAG: DUF1887 family protein [Chloroherpetonaceae bacterium]|nr:DUF1887 family protein [Chloroherpetonaceae bacterium]MDW8438456.1 hypothetical protein [Chloroherpetonaceae bacterium]